MTASGSTPIKLSPTDGSPQQEYRAVSKLAVAAAVLGLVAPLAMIAPLLWALPVLGVAVAMLALRALSDSDGELVGRTAALAGLALSVTFLVAAPSRQLSFQWYLQNEARSWGQLWFELLANDEPQKAHQLTLGPGQRQPLGAELWDAYRDQSRLRASLEDFVADPLVRAMLALGPKVEVHFWNNVSRRTSGHTSRVVQDYSISYDDDDDGERTTFFGRLTFVRSSLPVTGQTHWRITHHEGGVLPPFAD